MYLAGNVNIHDITSHNNHEIRIELGDFEGNKSYAEYTVFSIADEESNFRLLVYNYSENAGKHFKNSNIGQPCNKLIISEFYNFKIA